MIGGHPIFGYPTNGENEGTSLVLRPLLSFSRPFLLHLSILDELNHATLIAPIYNFILGGITLNHCPKLLFFDLPYKS